MRNARGARLTVRNGRPYDPPRAIVPAAMIRRTLFALIVIFVLIAASELMSALAYRTITAQTFSYEGAHGTLASAAAPAQTGGIARTEGQIVLHPYLGYVFNPTITDPQLLSVVGERGISRFGFANRAPMVAPRSPDTLRVAIFGGSVAALFGLRGAEQLAARLESSPRLGSRRVEIVNLGMAGYKQPQMLMTLAYALSLGAEFDVAINIDGYNEVALPPVDNVRLGVMAAYPREWANLAPGAPSLQRQVLVGRIAALREDRRARAQWLQASPLHYSVTALTVWTALDLRRQAQLGALQSALSEAAREDRAYQTRGAFEPFEDDEAMYDELTEIWRRSSAAMDALCRRHGIAYFHFLQPNQYVEGSKPMSPEERALSRRADHPYAAGVREGYPRLARAGEGLRREGVRFVDLRFVFADEPRAVYEDDCCHVGELGNQILADAVADAILASPDWAGIGEAKGRAGR